MATWAGEQPKDAEWDDLTGLLIDEVRASRKIQELLTTTRSRSRQRYTLVHRPLKLT